MIASKLGQASRLFLCFALLKQKLLESFVLGFSFKQSLHCISSYGFCTICVFSFLFVVFVIVPLLYSYIITNI